MGKPSTVEHFLARIDTSGGPDACHPWTRALSQGYGSLQFGGIVTRAHVLVWELENGPVPDGLVLDHTCHNGTDCPGGVTCPHRRCCNVRHLDVTTRGTNARRSHAWSGNRTHCPAGHPRTPDNLYRQTGGALICATCRRAEVRRQNERARRLNIGPYAYRAKP